MIKLKKRESVKKRFYHRRNMIFGEIPEELRNSYRYRKIMHIKAMRVDIRIKCHSCRVNVSYLRMVTPDLHLDIKGYMPYGYNCTTCQWYMSGRFNIDA